ncbi:MAG: hypothetical protein PGN34_04580 [Methylobacterium frigidaeris]
MPTLSTKPQSEGFDPYSDRNERDVERLAPGARPAAGEPGQEGLTPSAREAVARATAALGQEEGDEA